MHTLSKPVPPPPMMARPVYAPDQPITPIRTRMVYTKRNDPPGFDTERLRQKQRRESTQYRKLMKLNYGK